MKTTVVNLKTCKDKDVVRIDRTTIFGNPFKIGDYVRCPDICHSPAQRGLKKCIDCVYMTKKHTRETVIEAYYKYFYDRIRKDPEFHRKVLGLKNKKLGCWCKPKACHGDVIVEYLESVK